MEIPSGMSEHVEWKGSQGLRLDEWQGHGSDENIMAALKLF